jgi:hypothetical protein
MADIHRLEIIKKLSAYQKAINALAKNGDLEKLMELIKVKKGWTTPAEFAFASHIADSLAARVSQLQNETGELLKAGKLVRENKG